MGKKPIMMSNPDLRLALARVLRPLARVLIGRSEGFPNVAAELKTAYLAAAGRYFRLGGKALTDSRLHLLTGLQRKDIKALRARAQTSEQIQSAGPLPRVVAAWAADHSSSDGPVPLARNGAAPSFEALVAGVSKDVHPRTVLDELARQGQVWVEGDTVHLTTDAFVPSADEDALLGYFGANLGDHAEAIAANLDAAPARAPFLDRAVHYNHLTPEAVAELDTLARDKLMEVLDVLNARALILQRRDRGRPSATHRFRAGAYVYHANEAEEAEHAP